MKQKFKLRDIVKTFFNFNLANFDICIHVWNNKKDIVNGNEADEYSHTRGVIPDRFNDMECYQVEFTADPATITFFCSENDEDW